MPRIEPIWRYEDFVPTLAKWHWDEWGHADPDGSLESWIQGLARRNRIDAIPTTYVALSDSDEPIGSVALVEYDMKTHPELSPWLSGLYVLPPWRGAGIGTALTRHAVNAVKAMGFTKLYLHTSTAASLYRRLGWVLLFSEAYEGELVNVMRYGA